MNQDEVAVKYDPFRSTELMPVLFIGHGSPMNAIEDNEFSNKWKEMGEVIPKPVAILCISAHWETRGTFVTAMEYPRTIHDFGGFPDELFAVKYPAPGSPELAKDLMNTIRNIEVRPDESWGLDHGCWSVLRHLYPEANVPVIQMSIDYSQSALYHYELAKELSFLRTRGVLIVGSGNMVHNLRKAAWDRLDTNEYGYDWAIEANKKLKKFILGGDHQSLINYNLQGPVFDLAIPTPEHYLPLIYTLGVKMEDEKIIFFNDKVIAGSLSMTSFKII